MGRENKVIGAVGEKIAHAFLKKKGYRLVASNYRTPLGEIDLIARKGSALVFVEIKTRTTSSLGPPFLSVTWKKQRHIVMTALMYLKKYGLLDSDWRVDVVSVKLNKRYEVENIEIIENAVEDVYY